MIGGFNEIRNHWINYDSAYACNERNKSLIS